MATQKKGKKVGRAKAWCQAYRSAGRYEINRVKKHIRLLARRPASYALAKQSLDVIKKLDVYLFKALPELKHAGSSNQYNIALALKENHSAYQAAMAKTYS